MGPMKTRGWKMSRLPSSPAIAPMAAMRTAATRRASNMGGPRGRSLVRCHEALDGAHDARAEALPGELLGLKARLKAHFDDGVAVAQCPVDALGDEVGTAGLDDEALLAILDE